MILEGNKKIFYILEFAETENKTVITRNQGRKKQEIRKCELKGAEWQVCG